MREQVPKKQQITREFLQEYLLKEATRFSSSKLYKAVISFDTISHMHYHASAVDPGLILLAYDLTQVPKFYETSISKIEWKERADFSSKKQATAVNRHFIVGAATEFELLLGFLLSDATITSKYTSNMIADLTSATIQFATPVANYPPEFSTTEPFVVSEASQNKEECIIS